VIVPGNFHRAVDAPEPEPLSAAHDRLRQVRKALDWFDRQVEGAAAPAGTLKLPRRSPALAADRGSQRAAVAEAAKARRMAGGRSLAKIRSPTPKPRWCYTTAPPPPC
jgi:hypothetical protein